MRRVPSHLYQDKRIKLCGLDIRIIIEIKYEGKFIAHSPYL